VSSPFFIHPARDDNPIPAVFFRFHGAGMGGMVDQKCPQVQQRIEVFAVPFNSLPAGSFSCRPFPVLIFSFIFTRDRRAPVVNNSFPTLSAFFLFLRVAEFMAGSLYDDDKHLRSYAA
jgi:hypothetical protein